MIGAAVNEIVPGLHVSPGAVALVAMAATFGIGDASHLHRDRVRVRAHRDYRAILPIMLAAVIADLVSGALLDHGLMTEKLARRGLHVSLDYTPDYLQATLVRDAMTRDVSVLEIGQTVTDARRRIEKISAQRVPARRRRPSLRRHRVADRSARARRRPRHAAGGHRQHRRRHADTRRHARHRARTHRRRGGRAPARDRRRPPHRGDVHPHRHPARPQPAPHRRAEPAGLARRLATETRAESNGSD